MLSVVKRASDLRTLIADWRATRRKIGFVPTMGALHEGHAALVRASLAECDRTIVSIFVNPLQFDRREDLDTYPRDEQSDRTLLSDLGAHALFTPRAEDVYPAGFATVVHQSRLTDHLCGAKRPGHFDGVLTVVLKLFNVVTPDRAYFGQKDYQQAQVIRRMVRDLDVPIDVRLVPIERAEDGLALSSRNVRLSHPQRERAPGIHRAMQAGDAAFRGGERRASQLRDEVLKRLTAIPECRVDYVEIHDPVELCPREAEVAVGDLLAVAVFLGKVRLIDNLLLGR